MIEHHPPILPMEKNKYMPGPWKIEYLFGNKARMVRTNYFSDGTPFCEYKPAPPFVYHVWWRKGQKFRRALRAYEIAKALQAEAERKSEPNNYTPTR